MAFREGAKLPKPTAVSSTAFKGKVYISSNSSSTGLDVAPTRNSPSRPDKLVNENIIVEGIYNHLRFLRSCGKEEVSLVDVARALHLPVTVVERAALKLQDRGLKLER